ncbi:3'-5' exonuclease [Aliiroseovarius subalbicans]|uniref:3'-5' exonuclease n=1 Tax=Aliiroseovarius subalbicans TaxID=2925840 RepID=UPI001F57287F|nr:3'-5' exonuclease [Aliiroseovarius subalbicans]MCI2399265.1 3'-5' exonuclease [Aliiroseovarius subalbicans]
MKWFISLSLRLRIFLFFALVAVGGVMITLGALYVGYQRVAETDPLSGFVFAGVLSGFGLLALSAGVWFLFDENLAKPIERMATGLRSRAHAGAGGVDTHAARYLGDLAPAAEAVSTQLKQTTMDQAGVVAAETARLAADKARLTALLSEIPVAMVLVNPAHQIVLYDAQAAGLLNQVCPARLNASIFDYFQRDAFLAAHKKMVKTGFEQTFSDLSSANGLEFEARLKPLGPGEGYLLMIDDAHSTTDPDTARPVVFDFDLMEAQAGDDMMNTALCDLTYVVFDTETTGLLPHKDEIVQIGAVRVVKGKIVPGEVVDQLVNPGMKIPPASTKVHKVTDLMVADAPVITEVAKGFHNFARDAVLVAHNAPFDMAFLRRHAEATGVAWDHPILDTVLLSAVLYGTTEVHTLDALCERLGVEIPEHLRHTALGDAQATGEVLCMMLEMLRARGVETLGEAIEQAKKHRRLLTDLN